MVNFLSLPGYLARDLQDGRLSQKILANRTIILQDLAKILQDDR